MSDDPTRLVFTDARFARLLRKRLDGRTSHDVGPEPRSRHPPGCVGDPNPLVPGHHHACVLADRWARACAAGNCRYANPYGRPDRRLDCPGYRLDRRLVGGQCVVLWPGPCERRARWAALQQPAPAPRTKRGRLPGDEDG